MRFASPFSKSSSLFAVVLLVIVSCGGAAQTEPAKSRQLQQLGPAPSWPSKQKRWALVIGVDQYADTQITTLGGAANDAKALAGALVRYAGFPSDQVILLSTDQPAERQPTRGNILRRLSNMASVVPSDGLLLISFAGHGIERGGQAFLLPSDSQVANDVDLLEQTAINVTQMKQRIRKTGVGQVVLILDACRNDPAGRSGADNPLSAAYLRGFNFDVRNHEVKAFATLYATEVGHRAYEYKEKHQGYFTWELVQGLKGAAANERGEITLGSLVKYLQERVPKHVLADLGAGKDQKPFAQVGGYKADELIIAVAPPGSGPVASSSQVNSNETPPIPKVDPAAIELAYWETIKNSPDAEDFKSYLRRYPNGQFAELARRRANPSSSNGNKAAPAANSQTNPATGTNANPQAILMADILTLGIDVGMAEIASFQNGSPVQIMQLLDTSEFVAKRSGLSVQGIDYVLGQLRAGNASSTQYQNLIAIRQGYEQALNRTCNCGNVLNMLNVLTLGAQLGFMEVVAFQNGDRNYLTQIMTSAIQYAAAAGLPTTSLNALLGQARSGKHTKDVYQGLVSVRTQFIQATTRSCGC